MKVNFKVTSDDLIPNLKAIITAGEAILSNESLVEFFRYTLHTGNFVNAVSATNEYLILIGCWV